MLLFSNIQKEVFLEIDNIYLETVDSTNTYGKNNRTKFNPDKLTCIIAKKQTAGRGQFDRKWITSPEKNITATFCFTLPLLTKQIEHLAQLMAYSTSKVLIDLGFKPTFKWPNDILLSGKKVCGILCEIIQSKDAIEVFLGIGLNVNCSEKELSQIGQMATSLKIEMQKDFSLSDLLQRLQHRFLYDLEIFKKQGFSPFKFDAL